MVDRIREARRIVSEAADETEQATVREQLHSIERGLAAVAEEPDDGEKGDRLEEIEATIVGLDDETEPDAIRDELADVRDLIDAYRRDRAQDW